jgi:hypothetical protein
MAARRGVAVLGALSLAAVLLAACGTSDAKAAVSTSTCQQVGAVLSDGPDPTADPVGYAEAQILPLRSLHSSTVTLQRDINALADAYGAFFHSDGSAASAAAVAMASRTMDHACTGVTQ